MSAAKPSTVEGRARRITRNTLFLSGSEVSSRFFTWLTILFLVRYWSQDYYGQYASALNWATILGSLTGLGVGTLATREVSHDKSTSNFYLRNMAAIRLSMSILFALALIVIGPLLHYEPALCAAMAILGIRLILDASAAGYVALLQAHEMMTFQGMLSLVGAFFRMVGIIGVVYLGGRMISACWVWNVVSLFSCTVLLRMGTRQGWKVEWSRVNWTEAWNILKFSIPFAAFGTLQMLYYRVDGVILKSFAGNEAVASYDVAGRFLFIVFMLSDHFGISTLPSFSAARDRVEDLRRISTRALKVLILAGIPLTVGGFFLAGPLMIFLFGAKYAASGAAFAILAFSIGLHFATKPSVNLLAVKDPPKLTFLYFGLFVLNITANFILIPRWGLMGAATVSAFCEVPALIGCLWFTRSYFDFPKYGFYRGVAASFLASGVMGMGLYWDPRLYWLALGPLVYGSLLYLLGGIDRDDMVSLRSILKKTG